jgi:hypothetical protein
LRRGSTRECAANFEPVLEVADEAEEKGAVGGDVGVDFGVLRATGAPGGGFANMVGAFSYLLPPLTLS